MMAFMAALCTAIAALLTLLDGGSFAAKALYSFSIGYSCWAFTSGLRYGAAWWLARGRALRGEPPAASGGLLGWLRLAPIYVIGTWCGAVVGVEIADAIGGFRSASLLDLGSPATRFTLGITVLATAMAWISAVGSARLAAERERAERLERQAAQTQLMLLQSQLEPHMLFNTLANLRVLVGVDPVRAQDMLDRLIGFLRATLSASRVQRQPLAAEFERIADYLALMAVRMGARLQTRLDLPESLRETAVPPLLLQPLVENGIKHGLEPKVDGGAIEVSARRDGDALVLAVRDTGVGLASGGATAVATEGTRFGIDQVRERLATLYGVAASLTLEPAADGRGGTVATIRLPPAG